MSEPELLVREELVFSKVTTDYLCHDPLEYFPHYRQQGDGPVVFRVGSGAPLVYGNHTEGQIFSRKQVVNTVVRGADSSWAHCFSKCELTSSGPVAFLVSSPRNSCLTCVCSTFTLVTVFSHCCFRRGGGCWGASIFILFCEEVSQQLGLLLAAGSHCSL